MNGMWNEFDLRNLSECGKGVAQCVCLNLGTQISDENVEMFCKYTIKREEKSMKKLTNTMCTKKKIIHKKRMKAQAWEKRELPNTSYTFPIHSNISAPIHYWLWIDIETSAYYIRAIR